jgi:hypothetical protein
MADSAAGNENKMPLRRIEGIETALLSMVDEQKSF